LPATAQEGKNTTKDAKLDSLQTLLKQTSSDTGKVIVLAQIATQYKKKDLKKAVEYAEKAYELAQKTKSLISIAISHRVLGNVCETQSNPQIAIGHYKEAIRIFDELGKKNLLHEAYNEIAIAYYNQNLSEKALEYFLKALKHAHKINKKDTEARILNNIASLYAREDDTENAEKYFLQALKINRDNNNYSLIASNLNNLGNIYKNQKKHKEAIASLEEMLSLADKIKDPTKISTGMGTMANVYRDMKEYDKALKYAKSSYEIRLKVNNKREMVSAMSELGRIYLALNDFPNTEKYLKAALALALQIKSANSSQIIYSYLADVSAKQGLYQEAFEYQNKFLFLRDSLFKNEKSTQIIKMKTIYESEAKEAENQKLRQKNALAEAQSAKSNAQSARFFVILIAIAIALLGMVAIAVILYRNKEHKHQLNNKLTEQKTEIQTQNEELLQQQEEIIAQRDYIETQNTELRSQKQVLEESKELLEMRKSVIESSIQVALQIQTAMLPYPMRMKDTLGEFFVLNKPKDIVSGDYYWLQKTNGKIILAVVDCVGHGVPGALMSMIAHAFLDKVVVLQGFDQPADILLHLHEEVKFALQMNGDSSQGGMDMAVVTWTPTETNSKEPINITFGAAKRPLLLKRPQSTEIEEISGTRRSVGGEINLALSFTQETIAIEKDTILYLFSDGITDQNDVKRARVGTAKLKASLLQYADKDMEAQKIALQEMLKQHMQNTYQRDDILLIGVKV